MKVHQLAYADSACFTLGTNVRNAAKWMADRDRVAIAIVRDETTRLPVGVLTARNILARLASGWADPQNGLVDEAMTRDPMLIGNETEIEDALRAMQRAGARSACVVSAEGACTGILTLDDVVLALALSEVVDVLPDETGAELLKQVGTHPRGHQRAQQLKDLDPMLHEALRETSRAGDPIAVSADAPRSRKRRRRS